MRISKVIKGVLAVCVLVLVNLGLDFVLEPNFGSANLMWQDLAEENKLDTVYVGSSLCQRNINPLIVDEVTGTRSYNMGTSAQTLLASYDAIRTAYERNDINRAVLVVGYSTFDSDQGANSDIAWLRAKERFGIKEGMNRLAFAMDANHVSRSTSLNFLIPWVNNHVNFLPGVILNNINEKRNGVDAVTSELKHNPSMEYPGRGYECYTGVMHVEQAGFDTSLRSYANEFDEVQIRQLEKICAYCKEKGIRLIVINAPKAVYDILAYGEAYDRDGQRIKEILEPYGVEYYDFGLLKPEIFALEDDELLDKEHLNRNGADRFSAILGQYLNRLADNEQIEEDFLSYSGLRERTEEIRAVYVEGEVVENGLKLHGESYGGKDVEYRYSVMDGDTYRRGHV